MSARIHSGHFSAKKRTGSSYEILRYQISISLKWFPTTCPIGSGASVGGFMVICLFLFESVLCHWPVSIAGTHHDTLMLACITKPFAILNGHRQWEVGGAHSTDKKNFPVAKKKKKPTGCWVVDCVANQAVYQQNYSPCCREIAWWIFQTWKKIQSTYFWSQNLTWKSLYGCLNTFKKSFCYHPTQIILVSMFLVLTTSE